MSLGRRANYRLCDDMSVIATVCAVTRTGSYRAASRETGQSFRAMRRRIEDFERQLGFAIIERTQRGLRITGQALPIIEEARQIEERVREFFRFSRLQASVAAGEVSVAISEGLGTFWVLPRVSEFETSNRKLVINLLSTSPADERHLSQHHISVQIEEPSGTDVVRQRIGSIHLMLCASQAYLDRRGEPQTPADLADHTFIVQDIPYFSARASVEQAVGHALSNDQFVKASISSGHYMTIERGAGIGFLSTYGFAVGAKVRPLCCEVRKKLDVLVCYRPENRDVPGFVETVAWLKGLFNPKRYPWFRSDFVHPDEFESLIGGNGVAAEMDRYRFYARQGSEVN